MADWWVDGCGWLGCRAVFCGAGWDAAFAVPHRWVCGELVGSLRALLRVPTHLEFRIQHSAQLDLEWSIQAGLGCQ